MAYATVDDYTAWLQGRTGTVPLAEFGFWASRASDEIDFVTFKRLHDVDALEQFKAEVVKTTIELAEVIFNDESPNARKTLSSYSIGDYSESYVKAEALTPKDRINVTIRRGLGLIGLLFRG